MFKVNNKGTYWTHFTPCSSVSIVNLEHVIGDCVEIMHLTRTQNFWKTNIYNPLLRTCMCALDGWSLWCSIFKNKSSALYLVNNSQFRTEFFLLLTFCLNTLHLIFSSYNGERKLLSSKIPSDLCKRFNRLWLENLCH